MLAAHRRAGAIPARRVAFSPFPKESVMSEGKNFDDWARKMAFAILARTNEGNDLTAADQHTVESVLQRVHTAAELVKLRNISEELEAGLYNRPMIHLQGVGKVAAKPVEAFKPGEHMGWNYGSATQVERIVPLREGATRGWCDVHFVEHPGKPRRMKLERFAAIADETWRRPQVGSRP